MPAATCGTDGGYFVSHVQWEAADSSRRYPPTSRATAFAWSAVGSA